MSLFPQQVQCRPFWEGTRVSELRGIELLESHVILCAFRSKTKTEVKYKAQNTFFKHNIDEKVAKLYMHRYTTHKCHRRDHEGRGDTSSSVPNMRVTTQIIWILKNAGMINK
jgi:hypothetical protein